MNLNDIVLRIIVFIIIILLGLVVSKVITNLIRKGVKEFELGKVFKKAEIKYHPERFLPSLAKYIIYLLTIIIALNAVGITKIVLYVIIIILILSIIGYVLVSMRDLISNWLAGFKVKKKYKVGDSLKYKKITGKVVHMNLVELQIQTKKELIYIPYKLLK
ncbi:hypothetical protein CL618_03715 [archaeon]|nr:hypothetical protein [archaeon]|tara:strand:- start:837 stop:1319 length:483 start_codon:yes stop_codon:yes gene_type:complete